MRQLNLKPVVAPVRHETRPPLRVEVENFVRDSLSGTARHVTRGSLVGLIHARFSSARLTSQLVYLVIDTLIAEKYLVRTNVGNSAPKYKWCC